MSKIEVPQELQNQIIDLYTNKKLGRTTIVRELNLPFSEKVVKRILIENNIEIRNATGGGRKKMEVSKEIQEQIIEKYNLGYGLEKIVSELNLPFSFDKVRDILKNNNIHIRNVKESAQVKTMPDLRKYSINDDYVFESHNGAYILGFIAADGYLPITKGAKNKVVITLSRIDEEFLQMIADELSYTGPIYQFDSSNGYPCSSLSFTSKSLREKIEKYGISNNKTFKMHYLPSNLPKEFMIDYIRGYFDGDGSVFVANNKGLGMNICSVNKSFLEDIGKFLHETYNVTLPKVSVQHRKNDIYDIKFYKNDSLVLGDIFYNNDYLSLPRKKKHFLETKGLIKNKLIRK